MLLTLRYLWDLLGDVGCHGKNCLTADTVDTVDTVDMVDVTRLL